MTVFQTFKVAAILAGLTAGAAYAQPAYEAAVTVRADTPAAKIDRNIYGHFIEHLGTGIYPGIWVGEDSPIPNVRGIRTDVVEALKKIGPPVVRWPGGCFADIYQWRDGIGPRDQRKPIANSSWGQPESNQFGTHEFLDFAEQIGAAPYIGVNMGTSTPYQNKQWIDYMTAPADSAAARERVANGRTEPWEVPYLGVGNESWGCGGHMRADYYADQYRQHQTYLGGLGASKPKFIAAGADTDDYHWTDRVMSRAMNWREVGAPLLLGSDNANPLMWGYSVHFYTLTGNDWNNRGPSVDFNEGHWFTMMKRALTMDEIIAGHSAVMDKYDPEKKVAMVVDEWGTWFESTPGASGLWQQSTMRDAVVAGVTFNIFHHHSDRVRMANIAQMINVLQAVILTDGERMILTPTYHVFEMYKVHQDATHIPVEVTTPDYSYGNERLPALSVSASRDAQGVLHVSIVNIDPNRPAQVTLSLNGYDGKNVTGRVITADAMNTHNDFGQPDRFVPQALKGAKLKGDSVSVSLPSKSVTVLEIR